MYCAWRSGEWELCAAAGRDTGGRPPHDRRDGRAEAPGARALSQLRGRQIRVRVRVRIRVRDCERGALGPGGGGGDVDTPRLLLVGSFDFVCRLLCFLAAIVRYAH